MGSSGHSQGQDSSAEESNEDHQWARVQYRWLGTHALLVDPSSLEEVAVRSMGSCPPSQVQAPSLEIKDDEDSTKGLRKLVESKVLVDPSWPQQVMGTIKA